MTATEDFYEARLVINGFLVDYFSWRIEQDGAVWHEKPILPFGIQPEHLAMRKLATIFERRHKSDLFEIAKTLRNNDRLDFECFVDVIEEFGRVETEQARGMSYGRLVGLMALGGVAAIQMTKEERITELERLVLFFTRYMGARIELTWPKEGRSWAGFMKTTANIVKRDEISLANESKRRTWHYISYAVGAAAIGVSAIIGTKLFLNR